MIPTIQVDRSQYDFCRYMSKYRWNSIWYQLNEIQKLSPRSVLEVGPGPGVFKQIACSFGVRVETLDLDPDLRPDHIGSATKMDFDNASYDVVCAFQMLEHLPYDLAVQAFTEMARVCRNSVLISLPDAHPTFRFSFSFPRHGVVDWYIPRPRLRAPNHVFDGEHYWEINKHGYPLSKIVSDFSAVIPLVKTFRVPTNPYHRFFIFTRPDASR